MNDIQPNKNSVIIETVLGLMSITLNRPGALNSLTLEMIRKIKASLENAVSSDSIRMVLFKGAGNRAFCAGGDVKALAKAVKENRKHDAMTLFTEEYELDLFIHRFPKPVIAIVDGITMGGGLGLTAGADLIIATEKTRIAMPETRIGFFPDVGATGWMFDKFPPGYPEYFGLTGYEIKGKEAVRLGFATHFMASTDIEKALWILHENITSLTGGKVMVLKHIQNLLSPICGTDIPKRDEKDGWVKKYFAGITSTADLLADLTQCNLFQDLCEDVFNRLSERSPTAMELTLKLLRHNEGKKLEDVFAVETKAAEYMIDQPDYLEGIRARLVDKDDNPKWRPSTVEDVDLSGFRF